MFFAPKTPLSQIQSWVATQYTAICDLDGGTDVEIRPHHKLRSINQNRFLYAILVALLRFYENTGFRPDGVAPWAMRVDVLKVYYKARFGVAKTSKLDTKAFGEFIDRIQRSLVDETKGEWEILEPDSAYVRSLIEQGGF